MIIRGKDFARIADGIYSFHIEKIKGKVIITFTDATGGEVFKIEKAVKSKNFREDLLRDALITRLLMPNIDADKHKYDIIDVDEIIEQIDEDPKGVEEVLARSMEDVQVDPAIVEFYEVLFNIVASDAEEVNSKTVGELKEITKKYLETGDAPGWFKEIVQA